MKYKDMISKIEASEEFKDRLVNKLEKEEIKRSTTVMMKIRKIITTLVSLLGIAACSGLVYATVTGKIKLGSQEIVFSEEYAKYEEKVEGQYLENDDARLELVSTMCDEGFLVLQFNLEIEEDVFGEDWGLNYVSFNDEWIEENGYRELYLSGSNRNLTIDGENYWLKGASDSEIIENEFNKNYTIYQLYFLPSDIINNKEEFTVTLNNVVIMINPDEENYIELDGEFNIDVSKEKALKDTTSFENEESTLNYERLTNRVEKVSETPLQTIINVSSLLEDVTIRNSVYLPAEDYIGTLEYKVFDQNGNELFMYNVISEYINYYEDGTEKHYSINELDDTEIVNEIDKTIMKEYIVTEKNDDIKVLTIEVYERNDYFERVRFLGTHEIDLENKIVKSEYIDEIVTENNLIDKDDYIIKTEDIEYFDIEINEEYDMSYDCLKGIPSFNDEGYEVLLYDYEAIDEECNMIRYFIDLWENDSHFFEIILFKDKAIFESYCKDQEWPTGEVNIIKIAENEEYIVGVDIFEEGVELEDIAYITDTIKLK